MTIRAKLFCTCAAVLAVSIAIAVAGLWSVGLIGAFGAGLLFSEACRSE